MKAFGRYVRSSVIFAGGVIALLVFVGGVQLGQSVGQNDVRRNIGHDALGRCMKLILSGVKNDLISAAIQKCDGLADRSARGVWPSEIDGLDAERAIDRAQASVDAGAAAKPD
jgi:hypothetical protein